MKFPLTAALSLLVVLCLPACGKHDPPLQAQASPTPTPRDELDAGVSTVNKKAADAIASVDGFLKEQNPALRAKFQQAAEKFSRDRDKWRERLLAKQKDLQPQIERLKTQIGKADSRTKDRLSEELARLQDESKSMDQRLAELATVGQDGWKSFKARLKEAQAKEGTPSPSPRP